MLTGLMIDELIRTVEKAEVQSREQVKPVQSARAKTASSLLSPSMFEFAMLHQAVIGAA
jgi:hypothetical protein